MVMRMHEAAHTRPIIHSEQLRPSCPITCMVSNLLYACAVAGAAESVEAAIASNNVTVLGFVEGDGASMQVFAAAAKKHDHGRSSASVCYVAVTGTGSAALRASYGVGPAESALAVVKYARLDLWPDSPARVVHAPPGAMASAASVRDWVTDQTSPLVVQMQSMAEFGAAFPKPKVRERALLATTSGRHSQLRSIGRSDLNIGAVGGCPAGVRERQFDRFVGRVQRVQADGGNAGARATARGGSHRPFAAVMRTLCVC